MMAMPVDIVPIEESHIDGFHRALDFVARERRYLAYLEAPPPERTRAFVLDHSSMAIPNLSRCRRAKWLAGAMSRRRTGRPMPIPVCLVWQCCRHFAGRESVRS